MKPETLDEVRADKERHEIHVRLLTDRLDELDPFGGPYRLRRGTDIEWVHTTDLKAYPTDELGRERLLRDWAAAKHSDLRQRFDVLAARADRHAALHHARAHGIARFVDGGAYGLERLLAPARAHLAERYAAAGRLETLHGAAQRIAGWEDLGMYERRRPRT